MQKLLAPLFCVLLVGLGRTQEAAMDKSLAPTQQWEYRFENPSSWSIEFARSVGAIIDLGGGAGMIDQKKYDAVIQQRKIDSSKVELDHFNALGAEGWQFSGCTGKDNLTYVFRRLKSSNAKTGAEPIKETDIVGTWHLDTNLGFEEITFTADHRYTAVTGGIAQGKLAGTWRLDEGNLVKKWVSGETIFAGEKKSADGSETREKTVEIKDGILRTEVPGQYHYYKPGPLPEDFKR